MLPTVIWTGDEKAPVPYAEALVGPLFLAAYGLRGRCHWEITRGPRGRFVAEGTATSLAAAKAAAEAAAALALAAPPKRGRRRVPPPPADQYH